MPEPVDNLIFLGEVRVTLQDLGADSLSVRQDRLTVTGLTLPPGRASACARATVATCMLPSRASSPSASAETSGGSPGGPSRCSMIYSPSPPGRWTLIGKNRTKAAVRLAFGLLLLPLIVLSLGCGGELPQGAVAQVGGKLVSQDQFDEILATYEAAGRAPDKEAQPRSTRPSSRIWPNTW